MITAAAALAMAAVLLPDPAAGGVDGDGHQDLVLGAHAAADLTRICTGDGRGQFACTSIGTVPSRNVVVGDVDGNGQLDTVGSEQELCLGNGAGGFACQDMGTGLDHVSDLAIGDLDGDGAVDVFFTRFDPWSNQACLSDGAGGFTCRAVDGDTDRSSDVALADVDHDGHLDAIVANEGQRNRICLGDGSGRFTCRDADDEPRQSIKVAVGDVNEDGHPDAMFGNNGEQNTACLGNGAGRFTCRDVLQTVGATFAVALGDMNLDDHLDVVYGNHGPNWWCAGDGTGQFACETIDPDTGLRNETWGVAIGDVDHDGDLDAAFGSFDADARLCRGDGAGRFGCSDLDDATRDAHSIELTPQTRVARVAGEDRYATAAEISRSQFSPGVDVAYVATGRNFPDALAGGPVAARAGAPILLVDTDTIPSATAAELDRLRPGRIIILGGTAAVSDTVQTQLAAHTDGEVGRLAGPNRYATAARISAWGFAPGPGVVHVATGEQFPDALAGGPVAGIQGSPVLLVGADGIPAETAAELDRLGPARIVVLGGNRAVPGSTEIRLGGHVG